MDMVSTEPCRSKVDIGACQKTLILGLPRIQMEMPEPVILLGEVSFHSNII